MYKIKRQVKNLEETITRYVKDKELKSLVYEETLQFKRRIQILRKTPHRGHNLVAHQRRTTDIPFKI